MPRYCVLIPLVVDALKQVFQQFFGRLVEWKNRAKNMDIVSCGEGIDYESIISELKRLIAEADFFHIVLPEVERLKQVLPFRKIIFHVKSSIF